MRARGPVAFLVTVLIIFAAISLSLAPRRAFAGDFTFFFVDDGGATSGGLSLDNTATGATTLSSMGTNVFTFSGGNTAVVGSPWIKMGGGGSVDTFNLFFSGEGFTTVCMDLSFTSNLGTDAGTSCVSATLPGMMTFTIPSTTSSTVTLASPLTFTAQCNQTGTSTPCGLVFLFWGGVAGSFTQSNAIVPTVPEFAAPSILVGAVAFALLALRRRGLKVRLP